MLNCIEIIFLSQHRQSPFLSRSPTSMKLLASCLLIFSFRNQQEDGQKLSLHRREHSKEQGAPRGPAAPLKMPRASIQNGAFLFYTLKLPLGQRSHTNASPVRTKGRRGAGAGDCVGGRGSRAAFCNTARKPLCSELMQLKTQIQMDLRTHRSVSDWFKQTVA